MEIKFEKKQFLRGMLGGVIFGAIFIGVLFLLIPREPQLMYFWATSMVAVFILLVSISISKQSDKNILDILKRVKGLEEKLDRLHKQW